MNVLSLFSGIGGLDLGLERAGMTVVGQVEIDPWCRKVLAQHWPEVPRHDDVRTCTEWWGDRRAPDLVCGGFPCQPVSVAGKGLAQADPRWLWPAFADVIRDLRPRYVFVENTPGLLGRGMGDVLGDLAAIGYDAEWDCISAAHFGAPHLRERIWIVAYSTDGHGLDVPGVRGALERQPGRRITGNGSLARDLSDTERDGLEGREHSVTRQGTAAIGRRLANQNLAHMADTASLRRGDGPRFFRWLGPAGCGGWPPEPGVGRVAHGIPRRVDRLRGLGNAVVPQVAEHIGRLIMAVAP